VKIASQQYSGIVYSHKLPNSYLETNSPYKGTAQRHCTDPLGITSTQDLCSIY